MINMKMTMRRLQDIYEKLTILHDTPKGIHRLQENTKMVQQMHSTDLTTLSDIHKVRKE